MAGGELFLIEVAKLAEIEITGLVLDLQMISFGQGDYDFEMLFSAFFEIKFEFCCTRNVVL